MLYGGGDSYFTWHGHPGYLKCLRFAVKNHSCLLFFLFSSLFKYFFPLFFLDLFYHGLGLVSNIGLKFTIFFHLLQYFAKFSGRYIPRLAWPVKWYRLCCLTCFGQAAWWHRVSFASQWIPWKIFVWRPLKGKELPPSHLRQRQRVVQHHWQMLG